MTPVIKPDGTTLTPPTATGRGRRPIYPWGHLEVDDHFVVPESARTTILQTLYTAKLFGVVHEIRRGCTPGTLRVFRIA